ncbi:beta-agarase [Candidatus Poribacteria bacterium]|nr:beta-agarase [Candidatus Poribacteria bacterium]
MICLREFLIWSCSLCSIISSQTGSDQTLFDFSQDFDVNTVQTQDAEVKLSDGALHVATGHSATWPGITLKLPKDKWDLSNRTFLTMEVKNKGKKGLALFWRIDNPGADGSKNCITHKETFRPGEKKEIKVFLKRELPEHMKPKLFGMRGFPGGFVHEFNLNPANVNQFVIFVHRPDEDHNFEIHNIKAGGVYEKSEWLDMPEEEFFPMIDIYGQFIHKDWPNKTKSPEDLEEHKKTESDDLEKHPGPKKWTKYGGWLEGPELKATGFFRTEKYKGKWWLVDPKGSLFWSHGIDCVGAANGTTPITDREYLFKNLPEEGSPFAKFYGEGSWAPHNYYEGKTYKTYNFTASNLMRKYGEEWYKQFADLTHRRLRSWGMNTIANWSDQGIYRMQRTPYTVSVGFGGKLLEGSTGYWGKFRDVFDTSFEENIKKSMAYQKDRTANDPWCIGYFVDNEMTWGDEVSLAIATLSSPPDQSAKKVFIDDLKAKYNTIEKLNEAWGTDHNAWGALLKTQEPPERGKAYDDLVTFYVKTCDKYFSTIRSAIKGVAPNNLYLGCRFTWANQKLAEVAAKYCDIISYNFYTREIEEHRLPKDIDHPVVVGEFHFGALDRGMFHTGLGPVENQDARAEAYINYVHSALENPRIVGTHWFQYGDQATTGRGDGENYQIGFLDIVDTPYTATIEACRQVGYNMYEYRLNR